MTITRSQSDVYKAFAITIILICHFTGSFFKGLTTVFTPLGGIGVAVFLMLSGYGLNESWNKKAGGKPYAGWWRKRLIAVWIPYIITQAALYWPFHMSDISAPAVALDLFLIKPTHMHGWYLQYLLVWYVVFYAVCRIAPKFRLPIFAVISVALFAAHAAIPAVGEFLNPTLCAEQSLSFFAGVFLSEKKDARLGWKTGAIVLAIGVAFLALKQLPIVRSSPQAVMNAVQLLIKLPCGLGFIMLVHGFVSKRKLAAAQFVGKISYPLYLIHGYALWFECMSSLPLGAALFFAASIGGAIAFYFLLRLIKPAEYKLFCLKNAG